MTSEILLASTIFLTAGVWIQNFLWQLVRDLFWTAAVWLPTPPLTVDAWYRHAITDVWLQNHLWLLVRDLSNIFLYGCRPQSLVCCDDHLFFVLTDISCMYVHLLHVHTNTWYMYSQTPLVCTKEHLFYVVMTSSCMYWPTPFIMFKVQGVTRLTENQKSKVLTLQSVKMVQTILKDIEFLSAQIRAILKKSIFKGVMPFQVKTDRAFDFNRVLPFLN